MIDQMRKTYPVLPPALLRESMETIRVGKFADGGREALIALPALTLATGRPGEAKRILQSFAQRIGHEMASSCLSDLERKPEYYSADAPLWYFEAIHQFLKYTGNYAFVRQHLYVVLKNIISWYVRGAHNGVRIDGCGLINLSKPDVPLTWMNAEVAGRPVTPRYGKPVEIQALWYNALRIMEDLARRFGDDVAANRFAGRATVAHWSFNRLFWNGKDRCLYDVVTANTHDSAIRPNQIFAVSLQYAILPDDRARHVVEVVERELLTPFGLRTLAPGDPRYQGRVEADVSHRASAHQGPVWPWLLAPFVTAYVKLDQHSDVACDRASRWLSPLWKYVSESEGGRQLSEVFDGDAPHAPRGGSARVWTVAELRRVLAEVALPREARSPARGLRILAAAMAG